MSKSITQNRNESESNGNRDEISRSTEELNSIEGDQNLTECKFNENNSLIDLTKPSSDSEQIESMQHLNDSQWQFEMAKEFRRASSSC